MTEAPHVGFPRLVRGTVACVIAALAAIVLINNAFPDPTPTSGNVQQMTITSTAGVTVVVIPGFPIESIILGIVLGLIVLSLIHVQWTPMLRRIRFEPQSATA